MMEYLYKYFSKSVFLKAFLCLFAYLILGILSSLYIENQFQNDFYSESRNGFNTVTTIISLLLISCTCYFYYKDFAKEHNPVSLTEMVSIGFNVFLALSVIRFILLGVTEGFDFSPYFRSVFLEQIGILFIGFIVVLFIVINIMAMWKIFEKAGEKGWYSLVPILNIIVLLKIVEKPSWWLLLLLIPIVNIWISIIVTQALSKKFGKYDSFVFGLLLLPFLYYPILGFGDDIYGYE